MTKKIDVVDLDETELDQAQGGEFAWAYPTRGKGQLAQNEEGLIDVADEPEIRAR